MYFDEDLLLDIRLNTLDKFVKKFVITEATYSHSGEKKKLKFDINKFKKFKDKIIYIIVDKEPTNILEFEKSDTEDKKAEKLILNGMARDYHQREKLNNGLKEASNEDLILISDLDEIPNLQNFEFTKIDNNIIIFQQKMFYYKLNLYHPEFIWQGTKGTKFKNFLSPQWLRNIKGKNYAKWRIDTFFSKKKYSNIIFIKDGGWHFTCLKTPEDLQKKLLSFAHHYEFEESGLKIDDIRKLIYEKRIIYDYKADKREYKWSGKYTLQKINDTYLPEYVVANKANYYEWVD